MERKRENEEVEEDQPKKKIKTSDDEFGIIFHWGIYSVPAYDHSKSAKHRKVQNGSEWYMKRLNDTSTYRPTSGHLQTKKFHEENYGDRKYETFADDFTAEKWDPDEWMQLCKSIGATYVILTSKHHDGFCLFPTTTTSFNSTERGPERDLLAEFLSSARKFDLKVGIYYSWLQFDRTMTKAYMKDFVTPQIDELIKHKPDIFWFDGDWTCATNIANDTIVETVKKIRRKLPNIIINDRLGGSRELKDNRLKDTNFLGNADYRVYDDRAIPKETPKVPWEHINTIGYSWGRNRYTSADDYKSGEDLFKLYKQVRQKKGKFLLNLGPDYDGTLDPNEVKSLICFSELMHQYKGVPCDLSELKQKWFK
eukprot:TRINITY_DN6500_c0_g1_i1.p1 TRINITY_DN6500_c0_g1~~TRINITY_DN6500_c0_g1_i1.p1  ORF type:complete len:366 (-),score=71.39 TRINITY_DN6500_c0_g1_i1:19-1116(-)